MRALLATRKGRAALVWWSVWVLCLTPLLAVVYWVGTDQMTADPVARSLRYLGEWGLRLLVIGLALTPLKRLSGWCWVMPLRRMIGLYGFFYVCLHLLTYVVIDQGLDWDAIWKDIVKRPYITIGFAAFLLLLPLAITSTNAMMKRLGCKRWLRLHRLCYVIAPLGVVHYDLLVKADARWPIFYGVLTILCLGARLPMFQRGTRPSGPAREARPVPSQA